MSPELVTLRKKIKVSRRIIENGPHSGEDVIVFKLVTDELKRQLPEMERRVRQLADFEGPDRRKS